ncbi:MAG: hypothetical protein ACK55D_10795 [Synechococcaceae cyanobacterium]
MAPAPLVPGLPPISPASILRLPVRLLRFHQPMAEHGSCAACQPIGEAPPVGHCRFRSTSE